MAYTFFPKSSEEIQKTLLDKQFPQPNIDEIKRLFNLLRNKDKTPINLDLVKKANAKIVNVSRTLSGDFTIGDIKSKADLNIIKIKFGNGSSGNRGANNRGNLFEPQFAEAMLKWWEGEKVEDKRMLDAIEKLNKTYKIRDSKTFKVDVVGGENTRRPLIFSPKIQLTNPKGRGFNVGKSVTDITLTLDGKKEIYLSLKVDNTVTFFNVGIKTILTKKEIQNGNITNLNGKKLLDLFGLDATKFCNVFNGVGKSSIDRRPKFNKAAMSHLLQSGIGFDYHIIHKFVGRIHSKQMTKKDMQIAARVNPPIIYYGGKGGRGKRIDITMESPTYIFQLNIRDTQGTDGYPTRLMCNFKYR